MKPQITGLRVAGTLFGLMALGQFVRLVSQASIYIGAHQIPLWPSALAMVILASLCVWLWNLSRRTA